MFAEQQGMLLSTLYLRESQSTRIITQRFSGETYSKRSQRSDLVRQSATSCICQQRPASSCLFWSRRLFHMHHTAQICLPWILPFSLRKRLSFVARILVTFWTYDKLYAASFGTMKRPGTKIYSADGLFDTRSV